MTGTEVEHYEPAELVRDLRNPQTDSWTDVLEQVGDLAQRIARTDFVPESFRGNVAAIAATILYGREVGLGPMQSLDNPAHIKGKVGLSPKPCAPSSCRPGTRSSSSNPPRARVTVKGRRRGSDEWSTGHLDDRRRPAGQARRHQLDGLPAADAVGPGHRRAVPAGLSRRHPRAAGRRGAQRRHPDGQRHRAATGPPAAPPCNASGKPRSRTATRASHRPRTSRRYPTPHPRHRSRRQPPSRRSPEEPEPDDRATAARPTRPTTRHLPATTRPADGQVHRARLPRPGRTAPRHLRPRRPPRRRP